MPSWIGPWEIVIVVVVALLISGQEVAEFGSSWEVAHRLQEGFERGQEELRAP